MDMKNVYLEYRCPRWEDFPEIELYMDQVVSILENSLEIFSRNEKIITPAMINNYVKQKIVKPPVNKKYDRVHLAYFMVVCIFKQFMTISEICDAIAFLMKKYTVKELYNIFCEELENALKCTFDPESCNTASKDTNNETRVIRAAAFTFSNLAYAKYIVNNGKEA